MDTLTTLNYNNYTFYKEDSILLNNTVKMKF